MKPVPYRPKSKHDLALVTRNGQPPEPSYPRSPKEERRWSGRVVAIVVVLLIVGGFGILALPLTVS